MADVIFVAALVGFFLLAAAYVTWCDRIVTGGEATSQAALDDDDELGVAA